MLEVKDHANTQGCDAEIVQHQSTFMVRDLVNYLRIYDKRIKSDQVRNEEANLVAFVKDIEGRLLLKRNSSQQELDDQRIFVRLLYKTVPESIKNLDGTSHNLKNLVLEQQLFALRVHSCSFVVRK